MNDYDDDDLYIIGAVCDVFAYFAFLPFLDTFGSIIKKKSVWKQEKRQKVSRNKKKCVLPFLDTFEKCL